MCGVCSLAGKVAPTLGSRTRNRPINRPHQLQVQQPLQQLLLLDTSSNTWSSKRSNVMREFLRHRRRPRNTLDNEPWEWE